MKILIAGLGAAALLLFISLAFQCIRTDHETIIAPKTALSLKDTYLDTRHWRIPDYLEHTEVSRILLERKAGQISRQVEAKIRPLIEQVKQKAAEAK